jgi:hypothetical protein
MAEEAPDAGLTVAPARACIHIAGTVAEAAWVEANPRPA